jgi:hypothetical protein
MAAISTPWVAAQHWGTGLWAFLHSACLSAASGTPAQVHEARERTLRVIERLGDVVPCKACRDHYDAMLVQHPPSQFANRPLGLFEWSVLVHNAVNARLDQPTWTPERALRRWGIMGAEGAEGAHAGSEDAGARRSAGAIVGAGPQAMAAPLGARVPRAAVLEEYSRGGIMYSALARGPATQGG